MPEGDQGGVDPVLQRRAVAHQMQPEARPLALGPPALSAAWKSRRLRLRSRPTYNMAGPPRVDSKRRTDLCPPRRPLFMTFACYRGRELLVRAARWRREC